MQQLLRLQAESRSGFTVELFGRMTAPAGWEGETHKHSFWELVYVRNGEGSLCFSDEQIAFGKGAVFIVPPLLKHRFRHSAFGGKADHLYVGFMALDGCLSLLLENSGIHFPGLGEFDDIDPGFSRALDAFCRNVRGNTFNFHNPGKRFEAISLIGRLINILAGMNASLLTRMPTKRAETIVGKVIEFISHNLDRNIDVSEIASLLYLSPHYLGEVFSGEIGESIKSYHNRLRMQRAADLLTIGSAMNISQISDALGFESIHYFSRRFKKFYKMSPSSYRNMNP